MQRPVLLASLRSVWSGLRRVRQVGDRRGGTRARTCVEGGRSGVGVRVCEYVDNGLEQLTDVIEDILGRAATWVAIRSRGLPQPTATLSIYPNVAYAAENPAATVNALSIVWLFSW